MNISAKLVEGSVQKSLMTMTLPMMIGLLSVISSAIADTFFVGKLGTTELAAMGFAFPVIIFFGNFSLGLGVGVSSLVSRALGSGSMEKVRRYATDSLTISLSLAALFLFLGFIFMRPLFSLMGASGETLENVIAYMRIWYGGMIFVVVPMVSSNIIRATGNAQFPAMVMVLSAIINISFDPVFIWGLGPIPAMGIEGAAWASVLSKAMALVASLWVIHFKYHLIEFKIPETKVALESCKEILKLGIPTAFSNVLIPVSAAVVTSLIAPFGKEAVASFGIVSRVEGLALIAVFGIGASLGPFTGQNFGAKRFDRLDEGLSFAMKFVSFWVLGVVILLGVLGKNILSLFDKNEMVIAYGTLYFLLVPISYFFEAFRLISNSMFNGLGHPIPATFFVLLRMFILYIPLAYFLGHIMGMEVKGIFLACTVANFIVGISSQVYLRKTILRERN